MNTRFFTFWFFWTVAICTVLPSHANIRAARYVIQKILKMEPKVSWKAISRKGASRINSYFSYYDRFLNPAEKPNRNGYCRMGPNRLYPFPRNDGNVLDKLNRDKLKLDKLNLDKLNKAAERARTRRALDSFIIYSFMYEPAKGNLYRVSPVSNKKNIPGQPQMPGTWQKNNVQSLQELLSPPQIRVTPRL